MWCECEKKRKNKTMEKYRSEKRQLTFITTTEKLSIISRTKKFPHTCVWDTCASSVTKNKAMLITNARGQAFEERVYSNPAE